MDNWEAMQGISVWKTGETDNKVVMDTVGFNFVSSCVEMQAKPRVVESRGLNENGFKK